MTQSASSPQPADSILWQSGTESGQPGSGDSPGGKRQLWFDRGDLVGLLDLGQPHRGVRLAGNAAALLAVQLPESPTDRLVEGWVRGGDAVAIHEPRDSRRLRTTAVWRLSAGRAELNIELVLSTQTAAVRSDGATAVDCLLPAAEIVVGSSDGPRTDWTRLVTSAGAGNGPQLPWRQLPDSAVLCLLFRQAVSGRSLAICVRRDEGRELTLRRLSPPGGAEPPRFALTTWFFPSLIEKGVLHRSRLQITLGSPANDQEWAAAAARSLAAQPPLLQ